MGQRGGFGPSLDTKLYLFLYALGMTHGVENYKDWEKKKRTDIFLKVECTTTVCFEKCLQIVPISNLMTF